MVCTKYLSIYQKNIKAEETSELIELAFREGHVHENIAKSDLSHYVLWHTIRIEIVDQLIP